MNIREINETIEEGKGLRAIALSYGEIASAKIKKIRAEVEKNRLFFEEISQVYKLAKQQAISKKVAVKKNKPMISILLTSNYGFFGNIDIEVIHLFMETTVKHPTDRIVIGKTGHAYLKAMQYFNDYKSITLKNDLPQPDELQALNQLIKDYSQVLVFYSELETLLVQKATFTDLTQSAVNQSSQNKDGNNAYVIFEPELLKILEFFDSQITTTLLEQTFFEAELARTGSRIIAMDEAQTRAIDFIKQQEMLKGYTKRTVENARLLENLAGMMTIIQKGDT